MPEALVAALEDDLNTPKAFAELFALARAANASADDAERRELKGRCWPAPACSDSCSRIRRSG